MTKINFVALTDIGKKYKHNEDSFFVPSVGDNKKLFIVCDGVGGSLSGEVASKLACQWIYKNYFSSKNSLLQAIQKVNKQLFDLAQKHSEYTGMCTTTVCILFEENYAQVCSVGDSRAYLFRDGCLDQITEDDSVVWKLFKDGIITKDAIRKHPKNNIITNSLGSEKNLKKVNDYRIETKIEDTFLLCSDGLTDLVSDKEIEKVLQEKIDLEKKVKKLICMANDAGGKDNITVVLVEFV